MNPRLPWLWLFVIVNIISALIILGSGELIGDFAGIALHSHGALLWATVLVVASYLLILGPVFNYFSRIRFRRINFGKDEEIIGKRIGLLLIVAQLLYIFFNMSTGVNIAGANIVRSDSPFSMLWVAFPVDALFIIYYGKYRDNRYFFPNLAIWLLSNILRGWASVYLIVIFLEWCRSVRRNKISLTRLVVLGVFIVALYPLMSILKWVMRASSIYGISLDSIAEGISSNLSSADYITLIVDGITHLIGRIQSISPMVDVIRLSDFLQVKFSKGEFTPFWMEGLHGITLNRLFVGDRPMYIGVAFTNYEDFSFHYDVGDWSVSLGYASWFFITPHLIPLYILYTFVLGLFSFWLIKKIGWTVLTEDMLWFSWLLYILAPWLATFIAFLYALFVFLILKILFAHIPSIRLRQKGLGQN
jgi:hypothetical protein